MEEVQGNILNAVAPFPSVVKPTEKDSREENYDDPKNGAENKTFDHNDFNALH
jgi:hypothetical protein